MLCILKEVFFKIVSASKTQSISPMSFSLLHLSITDFSVDAVAVTTPVLLIE